MGLLQVGLCQQAGKQLSLSLDTPSHGGGGTSLYQGHSTKDTHTETQPSVMPQGSEASMSYASALNPKDFWETGRGPTYY